MIIVSMKCVLSDIKDELSKLSKNSMDKGMEQMELHFLLAGTGEALLDDDSYWAYNDPYPRWGDCTLMYTETYDMETTRCDSSLPYICEIH